jgi:chromosome segregation ATPase
MNEQGDPTSFRSGYDPANTPQGEGVPRWLWFAMIALAAVSLLALATSWNATMNANTARQALHTQTQALRQNVDMLNQRLSQAEAASAQLQGELSSVTGRLRMTQSEVTTARRQASQIRDDYSQKIQNVQSELAAKASADDLNSLGGDVNGVKTDLDATKNNLQMARGELGTLIARNHDQIDELRRLGERDYYEFTLTGKGSRAKIANMMVELRGTNTKHNQFTVYLYVDDMRLEKKNRSVDEPIYFYTRSTRAPLELVVNRVGKNKVVGYLSVPKGQTGTTAASVVD